MRQIKRASSRLRFREIRGPGDQLSRANLSGQFLRKTSSSVHQAYEIHLGDRKSLLEEAGLQGKDSATGRQAHECSHAP